ncbi:sp110 nuclear body protein [Pteronotus mesoamericanus]|uniref:sp110 nuclear body protein n=1 Tax=Pteronotus mesoamericanus TaxID=1884717 RepID=UPI0023EBD05B|nr:sp110 nuclear body protein [Pteronotus parnellii mesoamericanus]
MFTMTRELKNALREHFIHQKLEISYAIFKPFPFFEGLRDKSFITDKMYMESLEACRNMVPISKVVHNILTKLEDSFQPSLLEMLFSQINLREYPNLKTVLNSFRSVFIPCGRLSTPNPFEAPANPAGRNLYRTLPPPPAPLKHPIPVPKVSELRKIPQQSAQVLGEPSSSVGSAKDSPRVIQKGRITPVSSDNPTPQIRKKEDAQEMPHVPPAHVPVIRSDSPEPSHPREAQKAFSTPPIKKGKKRKRQIWSTEKKRYPRKRLPRGTASHGHRVQKKLQLVDQTAQRKDDSTRDSKVETKTNKARTECAQTSEPEEISDDTSEMDEAKGPQDLPSTPPRTMQDPLDKGSKLSWGISGKTQKKKKVCSRPSSKTRQKKKPPKSTAPPGHRIQGKLQAVDQETQRKDDSIRTSYVLTRAQKARIERAQTSEPEEKKKKTDVCSSSTKSHQKNIPQKEQPKDEAVDFQSPVLPVTCGTLKGTLYLEKMKAGSPRMCIKTEDGNWLTPSEFEAEGKGKISKKWKRNVRCGGKTLEQLAKDRLVHFPSSLKRERENADECEVCCRGGRLLCCDTCPRAFHEDCHIPPAEAQRSPWSCTFCRIKESSGSRQCGREPEGLARPMEPEEQLKCEFLLLKTYCHPRSTFFAKTPCNIQDYGEPFREAMWLDLVKERLAEKVYTVAWFVRDMRLIFHNHKIFYKASNFGQVGLDLETEFEKDLKEVLIFHEAKEKSFQAPP